MGNEMIALGRTNPVSMDEAKLWTESDDAQRAYARVMDTIDHGVGTLEPISPATRTRSSWKIAVAAAVVVLAIVALPLVLLGQRDGGTAAPVSPVELGTDHLWPDPPREESAVDLAAAFAEEVLGWVDATTTTFGLADPARPIWVQIEAPGRPNLDVLTVPTPSGGRVLIQVGSPPSIEIGVPDGPEAWEITEITLQHVAGATSADVSIRPIDSDQTVMVQVGQAEMNTRRLKLFDDVNIHSFRSLLIQYRDAAGNVITASGGHFSAEELSQEEISPQAILSDGVITEAEYFAAAQAVVTCLGARGVEASLRLDNMRYASFSTPDTGTDDFGSCHAENIGGIEFAWADQNAPAPETEIAFYNEVIDCTEAQTGEDYGDMEAVTDTRATDAALAAAREVYLTCFDQSIENHPDLRSGS